MDIIVQRMYRFETDRPLKAFVDIIVDKSLLIKGVRIMNGKNGLFVSMPREQAKDSRWYDTVRCLTMEVRDDITKVILDAYDEDADEPCQRSPTPARADKSLGDKLIRKYNKRKEL
jgi:stage V sporulation protein G